MIDQGNSPPVVADVQLELVARAEHSSALNVAGSGGSVCAFVLLDHRNRQDEIRMVHGILTYVDPSLRGRGLNKDLYRLVVQQESYVDVFLGVTHTPQSVRDAVLMGRDLGVRMYYMGRRDGDATLPLTPAERDVLEKARGEFRSILESYDIVSLQEGLPLDCISYGAPFSIAPIGKDELRFCSGDPVGRTFEDLIDWQQENRPGEGIYGMLVSVRERVFGGKEV